MKTDRNRIESKAEETEKKIRIPIINDIKNADVYSLMRRRRAWGMAIMSVESVGMHVYNFGYSTGGGKMEYGAG
jgi:hypothetical protein